MIEAMENKGKRIEIYTYSIHGAKRIVPCYPNKQQYFEV